MQGVPFSAEVAGELDAVGRHMGLGLVDAGREVVQILGQFFDLLLQILDAVCSQGRGRITSYNVCYTKLLRATSPAAFSSASR